MATLRRLLLWAIAGVLVAPLDALHVASGTIVRPPSGALVEVPLFAVAGLVIGALFHFVMRPLASALTRANEPSSTSASARDAQAAGWFAVGAFVVAYASSSFVGPHTIAFAALFAALACVSLAMVPRDRFATAALFSVGAAIVGPIVEATLSAAGAFAYVRTDVFGVPAWLPALYVLTGPAVAFADDAFGDIASRPLTKLGRSWALLRRGLGRLASLRTSRRRRA